MKGKQEEPNTSTSKLDPYYELANAVVIQSAQDYVDDYLTWMATYPNMSIDTIKKYDGHIGRRAIFKYIPVFGQRYSDAATELYKNIKFIHSAWFCMLTNLNATPFRTALREQALVPRFKRRTSHNKEDGVYRKYCEVIGTVERFNKDGSINVSSLMQYSSESLSKTYYGRNPARTFKCWTPVPERFADIEIGDKIAIEGEQETKDQFLLKVLNLTPHLREKIDSFEKEVVKKLKGIKENDNEQKRNSGEDWTAIEESRCKSSSEELDNPTCHG